ncbi:hypothetical protein [uncultured Bacteroides sp.]|nr:hypothetical protein [uncultured Bacteroides sp.]
MPYKASPLRKALRMVNTFKTSCSATTVSDFCAVSPTNRPDICRIISPQ